MTPTTPTTPPTPPPTIPPVATTRCTVQLPAEVREYLDEHARALGLTREEALVDCLLDYLRVWGEHGQLLLALTRHALVRGDDDVEAIVTELLGRRQLAPHLPPAWEDEEDQDQEDQDR